MEPTPRTSHSRSYAPRGGALPRPLILAAALLAVLAVHGVAEPAMSEPTADSRISESGVYITEGQVEYALPAEQLLAVLCDYPGYSEWAVEGLEEHPDPQIELTGIIKDIAYSDYPTRQFVMTYDVRLPWPFGKQDQRMRFDLAEHRSAGRTLIELSVVDPGATLRSGSLLLRVEEHGDATRVSYAMSVDFAWFLRPFFSIDKYEKTVRWRVETVLRNLEARLGEQ